MKRGTPHHPKLGKLAKALGIHRYAAVGLLEMLWHFTSTYAPTGHIGKYDDSDIADKIGWPVDVGDLIKALVATGWVDKCKCHRLVVHDWHDHADRATVRKVERNGWEMASRCPAIGRPKCGQRAPSRARGRGGSGSGSSSTLASVSSSSGESVERGNGYSPAFVRFWAAWPSGSRKKAKGKCWGYWDRDNLDGQIDHVLAVVEAMKVSEDWQGGYIPMPQTWLNQQRWDCELADLAEKPKAGGFNRDKPADGTYDGVAQEFE